jgi:hypothetical protein
VQTAAGGGAFDDVQVRGARETRNDAARENECERRQGTVCSTKRGCAEQEKREKALHGERRQGRGAGSDTEDFFVNFKKTLAIMTNSRYNISCLLM